MGTSATDKDDWLQRYICKPQIMARDGYLQTVSEQSKKISLLTAQTFNLQKEKDAVIAASKLDERTKLEEIDRLNQEISANKVQIQELLAQINTPAPSIFPIPDASPTFSLLPLASQTIAISSMNKYPEAFVKYGGRFFGSGATKTRYDLDVKAWLMQGVNDWEIVSKIKYAKAYVADVLKERPSLNYHQASDIAYMRVTHALGDSIRYELDSRSWGENEFHQFASETKEMGTGDCEDKEIYSQVGCEIAGIPSELRRIGAGLTFSGEGHYTGFYLASDLQFHHRNSTTNYSADKTATSLFKTSDPSEQLGIKNFWFSATRTKTFNWFPSTEAKREAGTLKDQPYFKFIKFFDEQGRRLRLWR